MTTVQQLLDHMNDAEAKTRRITERVSRNFEIYPTWTIKHLIAHLVGWDEATRSALEGFLHGTEAGIPAAKGIDEYNKRSVETRSELNYEQILREWEIERIKLKTTLNRIQDEQLQTEILTPWGARTTIHRLVGTMIAHELEHAREIGEILDQHDTNKADTDSQST